MGKNETYNTPGCEERKKLRRASLRDPVSLNGIDQSRMIPVTNLWPPHALAPTPICACTYTNMPTHIYHTNTLK